MPLNTSGSDSLFWAAGIDTQGFRTGARDIEGIVAGLSKKITAADIFAGIGVSAAAAFAMASKQAYDFAYEYEMAMKEVQTISAEVQKDYSLYADALVEMSKRVPESAHGLAKAYYQVVSAGYDGAAGLRVLEEASKGAVAGVTTTFTAVDGLTTVLNAFGHQAKDSSKVMDIMFKTVEKGKTTFPELSANIAQAAPIAAASGIKFEQLMAAVASLTKQGTPTAEAMTQIRASILSLNEILGDGWSKTMSYQEAVQKVYEKAGGSIKVLREMMGRVEGVNAVLAMSGDKSKEAAKDYEEITNSLNAASKAYETMAETAENQFKILHNRVISTIRPLGESLLEYASFWARALNKMLNALDKHVESKREKLVRNIFSPYTLGAPGLYAGYEDGAPVIGVGDINEIIEKLKKQGINIENAWSKIYDAIANPMLTAEQRQANLNALIEEAIRLDSIRQDMLDNVADAQDDANKTTQEAIDLETKAQATKKKSDLKDRQMQTWAEKERNRAMEQLEREAAANEYFNSRNAEWLRERIDLLEQEREAAAENSYELMLIEEELAERKQQLNAVLLNDARSLAADLRRLSRQQLNEHVQMLSEERNKHKENTDLYIYWQKRIDEATEETFRREREHLDDVADAIRAMGEFIGMFDGKIAETAFQVADLVRNVSALNLAAGDPFKSMTAGFGIAGSIVGLLDSLFSSGANQNQKYIDQMEQLNRQTQKQLDLLRRLNGEEALTGIIDLYARLNDEIGTNLNAIKNLDVYDRKTGRLTGTLGDHFRGTGVNLLELTQDQLKLLSKSSQDTYKQLVKDIEDARNALLDYQAEFREALTATTADSIADAITDGFLSGMDSAEIFAATFEDLMRNALVESFKREIITKHLNYFYDQFYSSMASRGELTAEEIAGLAASLQRDIMLAGESWEQIRQVMEAAGLDLVKDMDATRKEGLAGAVAGITERTAGIIEGQMTAIRIDMLKNLEVNKMAFNRIKSMDDSLYWLDDIYRAMPKVNMTPVLDRMDDLLNVSTRIADNTELLRSINARLARMERPTGAAAPEQDTLRAMGV